MTSAAIRSYRLIMHVGMTVDTGGSCLRKYKRWVARPAIRSLVLSLQGKCGFGMIEGVNRFIQLPAAGTVTQIAAQLEILAVRRIRHQPG